LQLWKEKTGRVEAEDISEKEYVKYGTQAEEHLRALFALDFPQYEVQHEENKIIKHSEYPFLFASLDGTLINKETGEIGILEIKTTNILNSMHKEKWNNEQMPQNYFIQVLHYLNVTGYEFVKLVAQLKYDDKYKYTKVYTINRTDEGVEDGIKYLHEKEIEFWQQYVLKDKEPALLLPEI
jgi:putative phage-type endonuclease